MGQKLRRVREQLSEDISEVATATGIDAARLASLEAGEIEATGDEVLILADHFKYDFKFFISNDRVSAFDQTESLYRRHGRDLAKADRRAIRDFLYLCEIEAFLMRLAVHVPADWDLF
jgi:transcriptional regulator with XRE-family HTH domain